MWKEITEKDKEEFNALATHPLQSFEWGEFRTKTGVRVVRKGFWKGKKLVQTFQITIHKIPHTSFTIGYLPKGTMPTKELIEELKKVGKENKCIFIQLEPNVQIKPVIPAKAGIQENDGSRITPIQSGIKSGMKKLGLVTSTHPLFTKYTFQLDLTKSEDELLKNMHPKTRYNIRIAQKHNVTVQEETSDNAFEEYWKLTKETTTRQGFYAHTPSYHKKMWETLHTKKLTPNVLSAHLLVARFNKQPLTTWILFVFHDTLYYPYGASSSEHRETMASNLQMWEAIKFGKTLNLKMFDMWGSLGESPNIKDPWFGFHRFKQGYGPTLIEFIGSYDLVIRPLLYQGYKLADKLRWLLLKLRR